MEGDVIASVAKVAVLVVDAMVEVPGLTDVIPVLAIRKGDDMEVDGTATVLKVAAEGSYSGWALDRVQSIQNRSLRVLCD